MVPTAVYQKLPKLRSGAHKCVEIWDDLTLEKVKGQRIGSDVYVTISRSFGIDDDLTILDP